VKQAFIDSFEPLILLVNADGEGRPQFLRATLWPAESRMIDAKLKRGCNRALVAGGNNWNCLVVGKDGTVVLASQTSSHRSFVELATDVSSSGSLQAAAGAICPVEARRPRRRRGNDERSRSKRAPPS